MFAPREKVLHFRRNLEEITLRSLTPIEAAIAFAIGGSILAVAVPEFVRGLRPEE